MHFSQFDLTCSPLDDDDKLDAIGLVQGPPPLLVEVSVAEVPAHRVEKAEVIPGKFLVEMQIRRGSSLCTLVGPTFVREEHQSSIAMQPFLIMQFVF